MLVTAQELRLCYPSYQYSVSPTPVITTLLKLTSVAISLIKYLSCQSISFVGLILTIIVDEGILLPRNSTPNNGKAFTDANMLR